MPRGDGELVLLVPGLRRIPPDWFGPAELEAAGVGLVRLLRRARVGPGPSGLEELTAGSGRSAAELSYLADTGRLPEGPVLRADPVHLRADLETIQLFGPEALAVTPAEAGELSEAFNTLFAADGLRLEVARPGRWYLHLGAQTPPRTAPIERVRGRRLQGPLVEGAAAGFWLRALNEVQMLFHGQPANERRERAGQPLINSLWLWGAGPTEGLPRWPMPAAVYSEDPVLRGWARAIGAADRGLAAPGAQAPEPSALVHLDAVDRHLAYGEAQGLLEALSDLSRRLDAWRSRRLLLWPLDGHAYGPAAWRSLWPRRWRLADWLQGA